VKSWLDMAERLIFNDLVRSRTNGERRKFENLKKLKI
jgi:hypothetical protein